MIYDDDDMMLIMISWYVMIDDIFKLDTATVYAPLCGDELGRLTFFNEG